MMMSLRTILGRIPARLYSATNPAPSSQNIRLRDLVERQEKMAEQVRKAKMTQPSVPPANTVSNNLEGLAANLYQIPSMPESFKDYRDNLS